MRPAGRNRGQPPGYQSLGWTRKPTIAYTLAWWNPQAGPFPRAAGRQPSHPTDARRRRRMLRFIRFSALIGMFLSLSEFTWAIVVNRPRLNFGSLNSPLYYNQDVDHFLWSLHESTTWF